MQSVVVLTLTGVLSQVVGFVYRVFLTRLGLVLLIPCLLLTGTENLHKHYFYGVGRVYPAALTELAEQVLRAVLVLAMVQVLSPRTAEGTVGAIVLGMAL